MPNKKTDSEGMALLLTLFLVAVALLLIGGLTVRVINHTNQVSRFTDYEQCFLGIEAATAKSIAELESGPLMGTLTAEYDGIIGIDSWNPASGDPTFDRPGVAPETLAGLDGVDFFAYARNWATDGIDNNGDGNVDFDEVGFFSVIADARTDITERRVQYVLFGTDVNVWNNAIFAGNGGVSGLINGNVSVHGSVHLLGSELPEGDIAAIISLDLSTGTPGIYNNYNAAAAGNAATADVLARVPLLPTTTWNGETVESLDSKLRVKRGLVAVGGNATIGFEDLFADQDGMGITAAGTPLGTKETVTGTFVNDGWTGDAVVPDGDRGDPLSVFSDNGWDATYDLGDKLAFPTYADDRGTNHLDYYLQQDPVGVGFHSVKQGDINIDTRYSYYWNATSGVEVNKGIPGSGTGAAYMPTMAELTDPNSAYHDDYYIWFDGSSNRMFINGRVAIDGNVSIKGQGNDTTINYTGRGTILTYDADESGNGGNVTLDTSLLTMNADGSTELSFPGYASSGTGNIIGIMAGNALNIGTTSQLQIMGGFYAQNMIKMTKQTVVMGTIVSNYFDLTGQVPRIYQVPDLPRGWDDQLRMIGWLPIYALTPVAWRELDTELLQSS